jgi:hypothetical protein
MLSRNTTGATDIPERNIKNKKKKKTPDESRRAASAIYFRYDSIIAHLSRQRPYGTFLK